MKEAKSCIFCSESLSGNNSSKEHVIPQWLLEHLSINNLPICPPIIKEEPKFISQDELYNTLKKQDHERRSLTLNNLVEGRICRICNNGWMSSLESQVKSILISLMSAEKLTTDLIAEDRFLITKWLFKTLVCLNSSSGYRKLIPDEHIRTFHNNQIFPNGYCFFYQQHKSSESDKQFYWTQDQMWLNQDVDPSKIENNDYQRMMKKSFKISLLLGKLILLMAYWPASPNWHFITSKGIHVPLWLWRRSSMFHNPPIDFPWENGIKAIAYLTSSLGINYTTEENILSEQYKINRSNHFNGEKIGRNDFCWCGSRKKFKKCHRLDKS